MENYLQIKMLHILGVVLFIGNIVVTALWKMMADRTNNTVIVAYAQKLVTISDFVFTATGALLVYITGKFYLAEQFGGVNGANWLSWGHGLFVISGLLWLFILVPIQVKQAGLVKRFDHQQGIPETYKKLSFAWALVGTVATILPLSVIYLMVVKPV